jgi:hypothetical protein
MDAWEILAGNSTIEEGDAWEHLNAQGGGGGSGPTIIIGGDLTADLGPMATSADAGSALSADLISQTIEADAAGEVLSATINQITTAEV